MDLLGGLHPFRKRPGLGRLSRHTQAVNLRPFFSVTHLLSCIILLTSKASFTEPRHKELKL